MVHESNLDMLSEVRVQMVDLLGEIVPHMLLRIKMLLGAEMQNNGYQMHELRVFQRVQNLFLVRSSNSLVMGIILIMDMLVSLLM